MPFETGFPDADARDDFSRARRRQVTSHLAARLRGAPSDVDLILPFDEVVAALGQRGQRELGLQVIDLDTVVGTVDRTTEFDRRFRPTTNRSRSRFERVAAAIRRGDPVEPIEVYRVGEAHFVRDGHHRVSAARALAIGSLEARVTEILTGVGGSAGLRLADLPLKSSERLFRDRVPLAPEIRAEVLFDDPEDYGALAENVEAWGFRAMQSRNELLDRPAVAAAWFAEEFEPVVALLREAGLLEADESEAEGYLRLADERWRLLQTWSWDDAVIERLRSRRRRRLRRPPVVP